MESIPANMKQMPLYSPRRSENKHHRAGLSKYQSSQNIENHSKKSRYLYFFHSLSILPINMKTKCCNPASKPARSPDSCWSWLVCLAGTLAWTLSFGISQCYAVPMPVIMNHFNSTREATGKRHNHLLWLFDIPDGNV